jgi:amphi-Trp domain-containing protein
MVTSTCDLQKGSAMNVKKRDVEKTYPLPEFITKLRRLADALESGAPFDIQVAGERVWVPTGASYNIEHERSGHEEEIEF